MTTRLVDDPGFREWQLKVTTECILRDEEACHQAAEAEARRFLELPPAVKQPSISGGGKS